MNGENLRTDVKISVVVPIYNAGKYLQACLYSIINQSYQNYEAILVDDGSTDGSGLVCDQYAEMDRRLRVIHKENEGLICARKSGLAAACGKYIAFVDADDWVDADFLETGVWQMEQTKADIVLTGCVREIGDCSETVQNRIGSGIYDVSGLTRDVYPKMLHYEAFYEFGILPYIWNKFYKKELLERCYAGIDTRIYDGEDVAIVYPYLLHAQKAVITDDAKYHYRIHSESMTANRKADYYENTARLYLHLVTKFQGSEYRHFLMPQLDSYMRMMIWQGKPDGFIESTRFIFPFKEIPKGASIILYGAGYVGRIFHYQITLSEYCAIVAWVDKGYQREELKKIGVVSMEALQTQQYDYVVLAVSRTDVAAEITSELISHGVDKKKIVFGLPMR